MKIRFKLTAIMVGLGLFAVTSVSITLLLRSRASITGLSRPYTISMTGDSAAYVANFLDTYFYLEKATQEITGGMNEMASGADQINAAVRSVNETSSRNRNGIEILIREVSRFKV